MHIRINDVVKRFGSLEAVSKVSLEIKEGELFTLLGPSGCGKTTLLRLIGGFYKPDEGEIFFDSRLIIDAPPYMRNIGMVFQNYALWPHMKVYDNIAYGLRLKKLSRKIINDKVRDVLELVNLTGLHDRYPGQLSGGQQQRVALARALVLNPDVLLLDEPLSNLDAKIRVQVRAEIRKLQKELKITTIYVTHDQEEALTISDRIAVLNHGKVLQIGAPKELYERPKNVFVADFIGTNNLLEGNITRIDSERKIVSIKTKIGEIAGIFDEKLSQGDSCMACIRPENIFLGYPEDEKDFNTVKGKVNFAYYLGSTLRYDIEAEKDVILRVDIKDPWHHEVIDTGKEVAVYFPPSANIVIPLK